MINFEPTPKKASRTLQLSRFAFAVLVFWHFSPARGQTILNVTNFGATGDAVQILASTVANSTQVTILSTNRFSNADIGKVVELFGAGPYTTPTNNQDLLATVTQVSNGTNLTLSLAAGATSNAVLCTIGTQNATAFQSCIDACVGTNTTVLVPAGNYLLIPPTALDTTFVMQNAYETHPALTIQKGGIHFLGANVTNTILTGNGAWTLKGSYAYRGYMFACQGPVTNDAPLIFDSLTMDGGVPPNRTSYSYFPASTTNGSGWDVTHDAVLDTGTPPLHQFKAFQNCVFRNWRGEMLKSVVANWDGFNEMTNCVFADGNATGINFSFSHVVDHCYFTNLIEAMEFYEGYCSNACYFRNSTLTNMVGGLIALEGAQSNSVNPAYTITNNLFYLQGGENGIQTTPAQNVSIVSNCFIGPGLDLILGSSGYQGSTVNSNILIAGNLFSNMSCVLEIEGSGQNSVWNVMVTNNIAGTTNGGTSGFAYGYGWVTNIVIKNNIATGLSYGLNSTLLQGQYFPDDPSNLFPPYVNYDAVGQTNLISYAYGMRDQIGVATHMSVWVLDDSHPELIPSGAELAVTNVQSSPVSVFLSKVNYQGGGAVVLTANASLNCRWTNGAWRSSWTELTAPAGLHILP